MQLQRDLFAIGAVGPRPDREVERHDLAAGAWVEVSRSWMGGADEVLEALTASVAWRHRRRRMYDRVVDEPRLTRWYRAGDALPHRALDGFRGEMAGLYGVRFGPLGLNYYRDGADSVAWHSDRELRHLDDTLVAIVTFGAARPFLLRPARGGRSLDLRPGSGDLLVMGGSCQLSWQHSVPKVAAAGPRISASIRWARSSTSGSE